MTATKWTVRNIEDAMKIAGSHWWNADTMRFFGTKVHGDAFNGPNGVCFITSEQPPHGPRGYAVRRYNPAANTISGTACEFKTLDTAKEAALAFVG
jgi:hypothetical protein